MSRSLPRCLLALGALAALHVSGADAQEAMLEHATPAAASSLPCERLGSCVRHPPGELLGAPAPAVWVAVPMTRAARTPASDDEQAQPSHFKTHFVLGFITSILAHEAGHVIAAYAVGGRPSFGFDEARPTIYSGIDAARQPHRQFIFSSAGLTVQTLLDELILDIPHERGSAFERGILAGGIATTAFYITLGRNARVSDVTLMSRTSSLSKTQVSLIFGGIAAIHALRIHFDSHYAHFFAAPSPEGALKVGVVVK